MAATAADLSVGRLSLADMVFPEPHAWRRFREQLEHIELRWHDGGLMGRTLFRENAISLRRGMTYEQRRCTIAHEILHVERGDVPHGMKAKEEEKVRRATARVMLPSIRKVGDALAWSADLHEAADELAVDLPVLMYRLQHLHPNEIHYLRRRLDEDGV